MVHDAGKYFILRFQVGKYFCQDVEESKLISYLIIVCLLIFKRLFWSSFKSSEYYVEFFIDLLEECEFVTLLYYSYLFMI